MKLFASISFIAAFAMLILLVACEKDAQNDLTAVTDNAMAEGESNRIIEAIYSAAYDNGVEKPAGEQDLDTILPSCALVTIDTAGGIKSITIDFGPDPCLCSQWDSRYRKGKIIASWNGFYRDSGTVITIITQDYYQGVLTPQMNKFDYHNTVTNMGHNAAGNLHYSINVTEGLITFYSGETFSWVSQRDREWIQGESTFLPFDDVYSITGSAAGTDHNGNPFTVTITTPLKVALICPWIELGTLEITHGVLPSATLDYGDGTCNSQATITINGVTTTFVLG